MHDNARNACRDAVSPSATFDSSLDVSDAVDGSLAGLEDDVSQESEAVVVCAARTAASAGAATRARWLRDCARDADVILKRIRKIPAGGADSQWYKRAATETLQKRGPNGASGALGQFRGHLFEHLDVRDYNLRNMHARRVLLRRATHTTGQANSSCQRRDSK